MKKRILSILISILMVISLMPSSSFADELNTINDVGITNNENNKYENDNIKNTIKEIKEENIITSVENNTNKNEKNSKENSEITIENEDITKNNPVSNQIDIQTQTIIDNQNAIIEINSSYDDFNSLEKEKWQKYLEETEIDEDSNVFYQDTFLDENRNQKFYFNDKDSNDISITTSPIVTFRSVPKKKCEVKKR